MISGFNIIVVQDLNAWRVEKEAIWVAGLIADLYSGFRSYQNISKGAFCAFVILEVYQCMVVQYKVSLFPVDAPTLDLLFHEEAADLQKGRSK